MKLDKLKEIKNVYSIVRLNNSSSIVSFKKEKARIYDDSLDSSKEIIQNLNALKVFKNNGSVYFLDAWGKLFIKNNFVVIPFLEDYWCVNSLEITNHIVLNIGNVENQTNSIYSLSKKEILWESENISLYVIGDYCFSRKKTNFKARNIDTGAVLWDKNITDDFEEGKTYKFLTVYNNVLVVAINDTILAGYNVTTGKLIWQVKDTNNSNLVIDKDGKLKGVTSTGYFETDIATGIYRRIEFAPFEAINKPGWFESQRDTFVIIDNYIITTDFYSNRIGAFNMQTMQYDWFYTEENATGFPASRPIKYFEPYLCLIDNKDTLHIYELTKAEQV